MFNRKFKNEIEWLRRDLRTLGKERDELRQERDTLKAVVENLTKELEQAYRAEYRANRYGDTLRGMIKLLTRLQNSEYPLS